MTPSASEGDEDLMVLEAGERVTFRDMGDIPHLMQRHQELGQRELEARSLQLEQALRLLRQAEDAFVHNDMLENMMGDSDEEGSEQNQSGDYDQPVEDRTHEYQDRLRIQSTPAPASPGPEEKQRGLHEALQVAKANCQKARDDFDEARNLTQEEIQQLP